MMDDKYTYTFFNLQYLTIKNIKIVIINNYNI
jgi:hypothetical protein